MPRPMANLSSQTKTAFLIRAVLVVSVLGFMVLGGLQFGTAPRSTASVGTPSKVDTFATGAVLIAGAASSLSTGAGPAAGLAASCVTSSALAASCSTLSSARPRPAISPNGTWINITGSLLAGAPPNGPPPRYIGTMVYDAYDGYVLMFGGEGPTGLLGDTWTYQSGKWIQLTESVYPDPRYGGQMAYDAAEHKVILFSGYDINLAMCVNDTWSFSNGTWTQLSASGPASRWRGGLAYDTDAGYLLLTGGTAVSGNPVYADTWKFVNDTWVDLTATVTGTPPTLYRASMVYDSFDHEFVFFGGTTKTGTIVTQTWTFTNNNTWKMLTLTTAPVARVYVDMVYDDQKSAVLLFGGSTTSSGGTIEMDTWVFQGGSWTKLLPKVSPTARGYGMIAYDPVGGYVILFGGYNNVKYFDDSWTFSAAAVVWGTATPSAFDAGLSTVLSITVVSTLTNLTIYYLGLPAGCVSNNSTRLACTPTQYGNFDVLAGVNDSVGDNASANISLQVREDPTVNGFAFSPPAVDIGYTTNISANVTGGTGALVYDWTKLPPGCTSANASKISCTPNQTGAFPVRLMVKDQVGINGTGQTTFTVNATPTIQRFYASPAAIDLGQSTVFHADVIAGTPPYQYNWQYLPAGCTSSNTPSIACTPVATGLTRVEAEATDAFNATLFGNITLQVNQDPAFASAAVSPGTVDAGAKVTLYSNVTFGTVPYTYSFQNLPVGCAPTSSKVSTCTPTQIGTFTITAKVVDAAGTPVFSRALHLTVVPDPAIAAFNASPAATDVGKSVALSVNAIQGSGLFVYVYSGLPSGCSTSNTQSLTCTPTVAGRSTIVATVTDSEGKSATANLNLTVSKLPTVTLTVAPTSVQPGQSVTFTVTTTDGVSPFTYHYSGLPSGCSTQNAPTLTCAPSSSGTFTVTVTGTDKATASAQGSAQLVVKSSTSGSFLGLPLLAGVGIVLIVILVVIVAVALMMRRRRKPPAAETEKP
ncbi:MAG: hypothetical protein L3J95_03585 [Thermoplasmata archaeon]|nr:hypothetical protein [Thermoplasmata archaeon]MCI4359489.1 hypothetical protein [Thermoplasmata archaeon]